MITRAYVLSEEERADLNSIQTSEVDRLRLYARDLRATAEAYALAADAPGLRKDAARYLFGESVRLTRQSGLVMDRADDLETGEDDPRADPPGVEVQDGRLRFSDARSFGGSSLI